MAGTSPAPRSSRSRTPGAHDSGDKESRALIVSMVGSAVLGVAGVTWGAVTGSQIVLFDGVFTLAGIMLVGVSMLAARVAASRPTADYPYGRHAATPLAVAMQGAALLGALAYGASDAASVIAAGGSDAAGLAVAAYGAVSALACLAVVVLLIPYAKSSPLARAELVSWRSGSYLSVVVAVNGAAAIFLSARGLDSVAGYLDPALVLLASILLLPMAFGLLREGGRELLEAAPPKPVAEVVAAAVERVRARHALPAPVIRSTKLGRRLYVDVGFVVAKGDWDIAAEDAVRQDLHAELGDLDYDVAASLSLTCNSHLLD